MGRHPLCLLLLSAFVASSLAIHAVPTTNTSYVVVTSDVLVPGSELLIDLHLLDLVRSDSKEEDDESDECVLDLSVSADDHLWYRSVWKIELDKTPKSFSKTLRILVSPDERSLGVSSVLKVESSSCFKFSRSVEVPTGWKDLLVTLRTDKLKYRPGEMMLIESLVLTEQLRPHLQPVNMSIYSSNGVLIVKWLNVTADEGLVRKEYFLPFLAQSAELILTLESHDQVVNHTVYIEQPAGPYDHECFLVEVRSPRYHSLHSGDESKSPSLDFSVVASHHSGGPLKGKVELQLSLENSTKTGSLPPVELETGLKVFSLKPDEIKQVLGLKTDEPLLGHEIRVQVKVEEERPLRKGKSEIDDKDDEEKKGGKKSDDDDDEDKKGDEMEDDKESESRINSVVPVSRELLVKFVDQSHVLFFSEFTPQFFKPGLLYVGQVLLKPVEEVLTGSPEEKEVTVTVKQHSSKGPREEKLTLKLKPNSLGEFSFRVPKEVNKLELEAQVEDKECGKVVVAHLKEVLPFSTKNNDGDHVQVLMDQTLPVVVGETLKFTVETTCPTSEVLYQVFCQSVLVLSGELLAPSPATKHDLSLVLPQNVSHLLSSCRLVVEVVSPSNELLSDSLRFVVVQTPESPLEVLLKPAVAEPGSVVELVIKAEPFTNVYLLSVSNLLAFEPKEQELRKLVAQEKMSRYLYNMNSTHFSRTIDEFGRLVSTLPSLAPDTHRVHNESESLLLTDGIVFLDPSKQWPLPPCKNGTLDDLEPSSLDTVEEFDSNLWEEFVGPSGEKKVHLVLREEARLYTLAAFGLKPGKGLVVAENPVQLIATSEVLPSLRHPESVVRGEEVVLEVHLFNNQDKEAKVTVRETHGSRSNEEGNNDEGRRSEVVLKPKELSVVSFSVKTSPTCQEPLQFEVEVVSDEVHRKLNSSVELKYQGYEVVPSESLLLDNFNGEQALDVDVPKNITNPIEKSERAHVKLYGHPLGPAIEHVCKRLNESNVLEERTKLDFVLAVNVLEHISNNSLFDNSVHVDYENENLPVNVSLEEPADKDECVQTLQDSLQYLLNKKNEDGSFSFYPKQPGYIWLTSQMLDSTVLLRNVVSWDEEQVVETLKWLAKQQKEDGSFVEDKDAIVLRNNMDEESCHVPLTSQVVASLLEACNNLDLPEDVVKLVESVTKRSVEYILKVTLNGDLNKDSYSLNLAAYALTLAKCDKVFEVLKRRDLLKVHEGDEEHWYVGEGGSASECSLSVEATSYAILTSLAMSDLSGARPFVNFVLSAMKPNGVFVTTEDTHVALKALSQYFRLYDEYHEHEHVNVDVNVTLSDKKRVSLKVLSPLFVGSLYFDHSNLSLSSPLKLESSGEGVLLVQSVPEFNEAVPSSRPTSVDLKVEVKQKDPEHLTLTVCAVNLEKEPSGFLIGEVPLLSGYELEVEKQQRRSNPQVLKQDDEVYLVFNKVKPSEPSCVDLTLDKLYCVGNLQPRFVKLYPSTEPGKAVYKTYVGGKVESS